MICWFFSGYFVSSRKYSCSQFYRHIQTYQYLYIHVYICAVIDTFKHIYISTCLYAWVIDYYFIDKYVYKTLWLMFTDYHLNKDLMLSLILAEFFWAYNIIKIKKISDTHKTCHIGKQGLIQVLGEAAHLLFRGIYGS